MARENGFREVIERDGRFQLLKTEYKNGDPLSSQVSAMDMIKENADLVGLFGTNEGSTRGVGEAIKNSGERLIGIGFDKTEENDRLLREGALTLLINQNPYTMGYLGMAEAIAALNNFDTGPKFINTGVELIRYN